MVDFPASYVSLPEGNQLRLVMYPIMYKVYTSFRWCKISEPGSEN